jgi:hypothetical protein
LQRETIQLDEELDRDEGRALVALDERTTSRVAAVICRSSSESYCVNVRPFAASVTNSVSTELPMRVSLTTVIVDASHHERDTDGNAGARQC